MASFDIVSKIDLQKIDNAINTASKELVNRYDLKDAECSIEIDKKSKIVKIAANQDMALTSIIDIILGKFSKQQLDVRSLDLSKEPRSIWKLVLQDLPIKEGIDNKDHKQAYAYAHKIKPTLDLIGLNVAFEEIGTLLFV